MKATRVAFVRLTCASPRLPSSWLHRAAVAILGLVTMALVAPSAWAVTPLGADSAPPIDAASAAPGAEALGSEAQNDVTEGTARPPVAPVAPESGAKVRLRERDVFSIYLPLSGKTPETRARSASQALERVLDNRDGPDLSEPRIESTGDVAVVFLGAVPIVQLTTADADAAGDSSLSVHAASVAAKIRDAVRTERKRSELARGVFSFSLLVFSGLIALLIVRKISEIGRRAGAWIEQHPERVPGLRVQELEVVRPRAARGALAVALTVGKTLAQVVIVYGWLVFALSLFETTRPYTDRLTALVLGPLSELVGRIGSALPLLVLTLIAAIAVGVLLRFVALFFAGVQRGDMRLAWLPPELAGPTGFLARAAVIVVALVTGAPLVTGSDQGLFARAGTIAIIAVGLACTPLLASVAAGLPVVYGRRLRVGEYAELGVRRGRVRELTLLEVRLQDEQGVEIRVPHLLGLVQSSRIVGPAPIVTVSVSIDPEAEQARVCEVLTEAARACGTRPNAELVSLTSEGAAWRVSAELDPKTARAELAIAVADALSRERIALGRRVPERAVG